MFHLSIKYEFPIQKEKASFKKVEQDGTFEKLFCLYLD